MKLIRFLVCLFLLIGVTGCLELHEIIQWQKDGSVLYTMRVSIPDLPEKKGGRKAEKDKEVEEDIEKLFGSSTGTGLQLVDKKEQELFGIKVFSLQLKANKFSDLNQFYRRMSTKMKDSGKDKKGKDQGKEAFDELFTKSPYQLKKTKQGTVRVVRSFSPPKIKRPKPKKDEQNQQLGQDLESAFLNMFRIRLEIFIPTELVESNAVLVFGSNLRWETTLGYLMKSPYQVEFEVKSSPELEKGL